MPNIKSAIKRVNIIKKKSAQNNMVKSLYKTCIKSFEVSLLEKDQEKTEKLFKEAIKNIDIAVSKGILKKNTASRKKSNLAKKLNKLEKTDKKVTVKKEEVKADKKSEEPKVEEVKKEVAKKPAAKKEVAKKTTTTKKTTSEAKKPAVKKEVAKKPAAKKETKK